MTAGGITTTVGLIPCINSVTNAPQEIVNFKIRATLNVTPFSAFSVPVVLDLRHECYYTTLNPPSKATLTYTIGDLAPSISGDLKFSFSTPTFPTCVEKYDLQENGSILSPTDPNYVIDTIT